MDNVFFEKKVYSKEMMFVTLGAVNMAIVGLFNQNGIKTIADYINPNVYRLLCIIIGFSGIHLIFNRDSFLPFLGDAAFPCQSLRNRIPAKANTEVKVRVPPNSKVVYWASNPSDKILRVQDAYNNYENSGVTTANDDGVAILRVKKPSAYRVPRTYINKKLEPHIHYRLCKTPGMLSSVKTVML